MKILITGGCGFIGSHTTRLAVQNGYEVRVVDTIDPLISLEGVEYLKGDVRSKDTCSRAIIGIDKVLHLAAYSRSGPSISMWPECLDTNINGTINVLEAALNGNVSKFVYAGSSTFYGNQLGIQKVGDRGDFLNFYGLSKYVGEELTNQFSLHLGLNSTILRYFNVYGAGQPTEGPYGLVMGIFSEAKKKRRKVQIHGSGNQRRDFIHVSDVARANLAAIKFEIPGRTYNIGSGENISITELAGLFGLQTENIERRRGDAEVTLADIEQTITDLAWKPEMSLANGIQNLINESESS
jgi:UDP-glucose 4-epimerase